MKYDQFLNLKKKIRNEIPVSDGDAAYLAENLFKGIPFPEQDFSIQRIIDYIVANSPNLRDELPAGIYFYILSRIAQEIENGNEHLLNEKLIEAILFKISKYPFFDENDKTNIWKILNHNNDYILFFKMDKNDLFEKIIDCYYFEFSHFMRILPLLSGSLCLTILINNFEKIRDDSSFESLDYIKNEIQKNGFSNCLIVAELICCSKLRLNFQEIMVKLRKTLVAIFEERLVSRSKMYNYLFYQCISKSREKRFKAEDDGYIFCEGILLRPNTHYYVMCRNRKCDDHLERCLGVNENIYESMFVYLIRKQFDIRLKEIISNKDYVLAMGSLNRINEISKRIVCGYGSDRGCGKPLVYSRRKQVNPGMAAYATTYWCCENSSCDQESVVKLSHCRGCGKIIDNRFDTIPCGRSDHKTFYICVDCGFCCDEHQVSGICPMCGDKNGWEKNDKYGKSYSCSFCQHEIYIPGQLKGCLDNLQAKVPPVGRDLLSKLFDFS